MFFALIDGLILTPNLISSEKIGLLLNSKMNKSLVSVIVPCYNVEQYLPKCIDSIINQTYKNL